MYPNQAKMFQFLYVPNKIAFRQGRGIRKKPNSAQIHPSHFNLAQLCSSKPNSAKLKLNQLNSTQISSTQQNST